jgi:hypothetical protein
MKDTCPMYNQSLFPNEARIDKEPKLEMCFLLVFKVEANKVMRHVPKSH